MLIFWILISYLLSPIRAILSSSIIYFSKKKKKIRKAMRIFGRCRNFVKTKCV